MWSENAETAALAKSWIGVFDPLRWEGFGDGDEFRGPRLSVTLSLWRRGAELTDLDVSEGGSSDIEIGPPSVAPIKREW